MSDTASEWSAMMPHRIQVTSKSTKDDFTYDSWDASTIRTYMCLIDESDTIQRTAGGVNLNIGLTAYVLAIPVGLLVPYNILASDKVEILLPTIYASRLRPIVSISRHFWVDGSLDNLEVRLS